MDLHEKLKNLPSSSGVYLMKDSQGHIIYVGKAKNLKRRVQSYFQNSKAHPQKVKMLVKHLKDFELILTDTEFEALMLECQLIKELKPLYNKKMKSPQSYTYVGIQTENGLRRIEVTQTPIENEGSLFFGPYTSKSTVERAIQGIKECFSIMCSSPHSKHTTCLNHSLGLCIGMCAGGSAVEEYNRIVNRVIDLLSGTDMSLLEEIKQRMFAASEKYDFEAAAKYKNYLDAVTSLVQKEKVIEFTEEMKNIAVIEYLDDNTIKLFLIKKNMILFSEKYAICSSELEQLSARIQSTILDIFKTEIAHLSIEVNRYEIDESQIIYSYLNSNSCSYINIPTKWLESENTARIEEEIRFFLDGGKLL